MKRLCVFYYKAFAYLGKPIDWIICKECRRKLAKGTPLRVAFERTTVPTFEIVANPMIPIEEIMKRRFGKVWKFGGRKARAKNASQKPVE